METKPLYITDVQAVDIQKKLEAHIDDLLADIRLQVVEHLADIINSYKLDDNEADHQLQMDFLQKSIDKINNTEL